MKVLLVHNNYDLQGGAEVFYRDVGRVLEENGHQVAYFSAGGSGDHEQWGEYFPAVAEYKGGSVIQKLISFPSMVYSKESHRCITKLIKAFKPDVLHAFATYVKLTPSVLAAAKQEGIPVVMSCNDYKHICPNYKLYHSGRICEECKGGKFYKALSNKCCHGSTSYSAASMAEAYVHSQMNIYKNNVNKFLFASDFMAKKTEEFWGNETFSWAKLCNPFNSAQHDVGAAVGDYGLYFGRLIDEKGVDRLLQAAALSRDVKLKIVGEGPDSEQLETFVAKMGLSNVELVGPKWGDELSDILGNCRFVVVPSIWHENFPYVIFQAFAAGKPVLGTNRGGIPELVEDGKRGWIYDVDNIPGLAAKLKDISLLETSVIKSMGDAAKSYVVKQFSDEKFYSDLIGIYGEFVK